MRYVFEDCTLDTQRYELRRGGVHLPIRRKVFQVLVFLIEQRHRVVSRDELLAQVWPNQCVSDETLTSCEGGAPGRWGQRARPAGDPDGARPRAPVRGACHGDRHLSCPEHTPRVSPGAGSGEPCIKAPGRP